MSEQTITVEINRDAIQDMPIEALELFEKAASGQLSAREMLDLLDGIVVGGCRGRGFKMRDLSAITAAISAAFRAETTGGAGASS